MYVRFLGGSAYYNRTDFYADGASLRIPKMFESFDDESAHAFVDCIKNNSILKRRIRSHVNNCLLYIKVKEISNIVEEFGIS